MTIFIPSDFLSFLQECLSKWERVKAILMNYNRVDGIGNETYEYPNLTLKVCSGDYVSDLWDAVLFYKATQGNDEAAAIQAKEQILFDAKTAYNKIIPDEAQLRVEENEHLLFVVYAGYTLLDLPIQLASEVKEKIGERATVVVLTCECDEYEKMKRLLPLLKQGKIDHLIKTRNCGGQLETGNIAFTLMQHANGS